MRFTLPIFIFATLIFGNQKFVDSKTGKEISLYNKYWAVIIGIDDYENEKPLSYCVADAKSIQSMNLDTIPFGSGVLLRLKFSDYTAGTQSCINDIILSDPNGNNAEVSNFSEQNNNCITVE